MSRAAWMVFAGLLVLAMTGIAAPPAASAGNAARNPADAARMRKGSLLRTLTTSTPEAVASLRKGCVRGIMPRSHRNELANGRDWAPDAVDECVTILTRHGRDGTLDALYRTILLEQTRDATGAATLAGEIAGAVMQAKRDELPLARALSLKITAALAFDAGFTNGYRDTGKPKAEIDRLPDEAALKPLAERCLDLVEAKLDGCYSAGYLYGLRAAHGALVAAAR